MVEQAKLNLIFKSLADDTRRDILARVLERSQTISELAVKYDMSFAATAKHITVLEKAELISKRKHGKEQIISIGNTSFISANNYLLQYEQLWNSSFNRLQQVLNKETR